LLGDKTSHLLVHNNDTFVIWLGSRKQVNKLAVALGLLAILAAPVAFSATPVYA